MFQFTEAQTVEIMAAFTLFLVALQNYLTFLLKKKLVEVQNQQRKNTRTLKKQNEVLGVSQDDWETNDTNETDGAQ